MLAKIHNVSLRDHNRIVLALMLVRLATFTLNGISKSEADLQAAFEYAIK